MDTVRNYIQLARDCLKMAKRAPNTGHPREMLAYGDPRAIGTKRALPAPAPSTRDGCFGEHWAAAGRRQFRAKPLI